MSGREAPKRTGKLSDTTTRICLGVRARVAALSVQAVTCHCNVDSEGERFPLKEMPHSPPIPDPVDVHDACIDHLGRTND